MNDKKDHLQLVRSDNSTKTYSPAPGVQIDVPPPCRGMTFRGKTSYDQLTPLEQQLHLVLMNKRFAEIVKLNEAVTSSNAARPARWLKSSEIMPPPKVIPFQPMSLGTDQGDPE